MQLVQLLDELSRFGSFEIALFRTVFTIVPYLAISVKFLTSVLNSIIMYISELT